MSISTNNACWYIDEDFIDFIDEFGELEFLLICVSLKFLSAVFWTFYCTDFIFFSLIIEVYLTYINFSFTKQWFNIFIDYAPYKVIIIVFTIFSVVYITFLWLFYFIISSLYLLTSYTYLPISRPLSLPRCRSNLCIINR